jgi:hypothetical protein
LYTAIILYDLEKDRQWGPGMAPLFIVAKKDGTPGSFRLDRFQTRKGFDNNSAGFAPP